MITIDRLSMPSTWTPKVGDLLQITNITEIGKGRWVYKVEFAWRKEVSMTRPNWDSYFMNIAKEVAKRATCPRASVGAVIVKDRRILATGYNGAPPGKPHCTDEGCIIVNDHCTRAIHAESNAIAQAARHGILLEGATLYYWDSKGREADSLDELQSHCYPCGLLAEAVGIVKVCGRG